MTEATAQCLNGLLVIAQNNFENQAGRRLLIYHARFERQLELMEELIQLACDADPAMWSAQQDVAAAQEWVRQLSDLLKKIEEVR